MTVNLGIDITVVVFFLLTVSIPTGLSLVGGLRGTGSGRGPVLPKCLIEGEGAVN